MGQSGERAFGKRRALLTSRPQDPIQDACSVRLLSPRIRADRARLGMASSCVSWPIVALINELLARLYDLPNVDVEGLSKNQKGVKEIFASNHHRHV